MVCFVILHYNAIEETRKCIKSIEALNYKSKRIIIVDNCSPNGSGVELKKEYGSNANIDILLTKDNLGYAKGNNVGYDYAKKYKPDFIVVLNSDVIIEQNDFCELIYKQYDRKKFHVLGPQIFCPPMGIYQNPKRLNHYTKEEIKKEIMIYEKKVKHLFWGKIKCFIKKIKPLKKIISKIKKNNHKIYYNREYTDVILHGSCLIFSRDFIKIRKNCFNPATFMYYETEILDYECKNDNMIEIYSPKLKVVHNHNASTNYTFKNEFKKVCFMNDCILHSLKEFYKIIDEK